MKCSARMIGVIYEVHSANVKRSAGLRAAGLNASIGVNYEVLSANDWRNL